jgi:hypothetical protein
MIQSFSGGSAISCDDDMLYSERYIDMVLKGHLNDPKFNIEIDNKYIPNLFIFILRESGATNRIDKCDLPDEVYCPTLLYKLASASPAKFKNKTVPKPPKHGAIGVFADDGLFKHIAEYKNVIIDIEKYYITILKKFE